MYTNNELSVVRIHFFDYFNWVKVILFTLVGALKDL